MTNAALPQEEKEGQFFTKGPFLSHSQVNKYLGCPEQYRLYYIEGLRARYPDANLVFGQLLHQSLALLFRAGADPVKSFTDAWTAVKEVKLTYSKKDTWEKLDTVGQGLLKKFLSEELPRLQHIDAAEESFTLEITSLNLPFVGIIDLFARLDGKWTVVDFKTSASGYQEHEAHMSDQLTAYQLAKPDAEQAALCVLVKTKDPKIEWHVARRTALQLAEYLGKVQLIGQEIAARRFYKRPGMWCTWCDYLPCCMGDRKRVEETLIKVR